MATFKVRDKETGEIFTVREKTSEAPVETQPPQESGVVKGIFGDVPQEAYNQGERNIAGNVFERPAAAVRGAILNPTNPVQGYTQGATNPESVPTFNKLSEKMMGTNTYNNFALANAGTVADIATNPADMLGLLIGKTPTPWGELGEFAGKAAVRGSNAIKTAMKSQKILSQAERADVAIDGLRETVGKATRLALDPVKQAPTNFDFMNYKNTPNIVSSALKRPEYGIELAKGKIVQTVDNLDRVRQMLGDLNKAKWDGKTDMQGKAISHLYGEVRKEIVNASERFSKGSGENISKALDSFSDFMDQYSLIKPVLTNKKQLARSNGIKALFKPGVDENVREAITAVSQSSPELRGVMNEIKRNELLGRLLKSTGKVAKEATKAAITGGSVYGGWKLGKAVLG